MSPLEEQQVLFTDEPSLQPHFIVVNIGDIINGNGLRLMYQKNCFEAGEKAPVSDTVTHTLIPALCGWSGAA